MDGAENLDDTSEGNEKRSFEFDLVLAVRRNDMAAVVDFVENQGYSVTASDVDGHPCLHYGVFNLFLHSIVFTPVPFSCSE